MRQDLAQLRWVVVEAREHDGVDPRPDGEEDRRRGGGESRVEDQGQRREPAAQPLDLPGAGAAFELRVDGGQLHRAGSDCRQGVIPASGMHHREPRGGRPAELMKLDGGDGG